MMAKVTAFIGVIGSGKDYQAGLLRAGGAAQINFKDPLLEMASDLVGYDVRLDYQWFKKAIVGVRRSDNPFIADGDMSDCKALCARHPAILTGRKLLQQLGTDVMRKRDPDYWSKEWMLSAIRLMQQGQDVVVADCRFPNEVEAVKFAAVKAEGEAEFIFCNYRSDQYDSSVGHESEKMAQSLLALGPADGEQITDWHFHAAGVHA